MVRRRRLDEEAAEFDLLPVPVARRWPEREPEQGLLGKFFMRYEEVHAEHAPETGSEPEPRKE